MADWWSTLSLMEQFFYGTGLLSLFSGFILATLTVFGLDGTSSHYQPENPHPDKGIRFISIHSVVAFLLGFGWGGIVCLKIGLHPIVVFLLAIGLGMVLMALMYLLLLSIFGLHGKSSLDLSMAIGSIAEVYSTIPAKRSGKGKVRVWMGDETITADAETNAVSSFRPGDQVRIIERIAKSRFLVREK